MSFWVYILASGRNGTLYTGHTDDLVRRVSEHRAGTFSGFTKRYAVHDLVWREEHPTRDSAFIRERRIKGWKRLWKLELIERSNPGWRDLLDDFDGRTGDPAAEAARFVTRLDDEKSLGPGVRRDERKLEEAQPSVGDGAHA